MNGKSLMKDLVGTVASRAGVELIAQWRLANLHHARRLRSVFSHFGIKAVIDVGANEGQFRDMLRQELGFSEWIYSFEPDPALASALERRAANDPGWNVQPFALGRVPGRGELNIMQEPSYNSFRDPAQDQAPGHASRNKVLRSVDVEIRTLDAVAGMFADLPHTYLKIDTQGFDLEVIAGGTDTLRRIPALQIEIPVRPIYQDTPSFEESLAVLRSQGFAIADMFLVSSDDQLRAVEFDCLMVRDGSAP